MPSELEQLRVVNQHFRLTLDQVDRGVMILEAEPLEYPGPRIVYVNRMIQSLTGYSREELLGRSLSYILEEEQMQKFFETSHGETIQVIRALLLCADGSLRPCYWKVGSAKNREGQALNFILSLHPIVEENQEIKEVKEIKNGIEEKGQLHASKMESLAMVASGVAHDFNNILTTIMANLSLAEMSAGENKESSAHLNAAMEASEAARSLVRQLLSFARGGQPHKVRQNLGSLLQRAERLATSGANIRCEFIIPEDTWDCEIDITQIMQVFNNLIINARQAMPEGGVVSGGVSHFVLKEDKNERFKKGKYVCVTVRDHGCGISKENLEKIFQAFFTTKEKGSGLGLATSYTIVSEHGGEIEVESTLKEGTEFRVYLPALGPLPKKPEEKIETLDAQFPAKTSEALSTKRWNNRVFPVKRISTQEKKEEKILIVDDQKSVRKVAQAILQKLGYKTAEVENGRDAVAAYQKALALNAPFRAVLMDITLPGGMNGEEAMLAIKKIDREALVIASSGYFEQESETIYQLKGFTKVLAKPYTVNELKHCLLELKERLKSSL